MPLKLRYKIPNNTDVHKFNNRIIGSLKSNSGHISLYTTDLCAGYIRNGTDSATFKAGPIDRFSHSPGPNHRASAVSRRSLSCQLLVVILCHSQFLYPTAYRAAFSSRIWRREVSGTNPQTKTIITNDQMIRVYHVHLQSALALMMADKTTPTMGPTSMVVVNIIIGLQSHQSGQTWYITRCAYNPTDRLGKMSDITAPATAADVDPTSPLMKRKVRCMPISVAGGLSDDVEDGFEASLPKHLPKATGTLNTFVVSLRMSYWKTMNARKNKVDDAVMTFLRPVTSESGPLITEKRQSSHLICKWTAEGVTH